MRVYVLYFSRIWSVIHLNRPNCADLSPVVVCSIVIVVIGSLSVQKSRYDVKVFYAYIYWDLRMERGKNGPRSPSGEKGERVRPEYDCFGCTGAA